MKNKFTSIFKLLSLAFFLCSGVSLFAQPANDLCGGAIEIGIAVDEASCVWVDATTVGTTSASAIAATTPTVCSGSWFEDDVWFSVTTGATVPVTGLVVRTEFGSVAGDVPAVGMAFYNSCDAGAASITCFSSAVPEQNSFEIAPNCLAPNTSYLVRVWSGVSPADNTGTFRICAFENPNPVPVELNTVFWEEDFSNGMNGFTSTSQTDPEDVWEWSADGTFAGLFGDPIYSINGPFSACSPSVGIAAAFYQTNMTGNGDSVIANVPAANYEEYVSELISPDIDLSAVSTPVSVQFDQAYRRLNVSAAGGPIASVSYSVDGGANWTDPVEVNADMEANDPLRDNIVKVPLPGAEGNANVRVRFIWQGDFYVWVLDRIQIVEADRNEIVALRSSAGNSYGTPASQIYPVSFLMDIGNNGVSTATGVTATATIEDLSTNATVFSETVNIPNINPFAFADDTDVAFDNIWPSSYTPPSVPGAYRGAFTIDSDSLDQNLTNNDLDFEFTITDTVFRKDSFDPVPGSTANLPGILPADPDWTYGAGYFVPNGDGFYASSVTFAISNTDDPLFIGSNIHVILYKWEDINDDGIAQAEERGFGNPILGGEILGDFTYTIDGTEIFEDQDITVVLDNFSSAGDILLEDNAQYIVAVEMFSPAGNLTPVSIVADDEVNYLNSWFVNDSLASIAPGQFFPQWGAFFSNETGFDAELTNDFGFSPHIHLNVNEVITINTKDQLDEANQIQVYPNPANEIVTVDMSLVNTFEKVNVRITDVSGKVLQDVHYQNVLNEQFTYNLNNYAPGTYFIQVNTEEGNRTTRFVVVK